MVVSQISGMSSTLNKQECTQEFHKMGRFIECGLAIVDLNKQTKNPNFLTR